MKTKLQEILDKNSWLTQEIVRKEKMAEKTIKKAANWEPVRYQSKFRIFMSLVELQVISPDTKLYEFFTSSPDELWHKK